MLWSLLMSLLRRLRGRSVLWCLLVPLLRRLLVPLLRRLRGRWTARRLRRSGIARLPGWVIGRPGGLLRRLACRSGLSRTGWCRLLPRILRSGG